MNFSYFDQFSDIEIDMTNYITNMSTSAFNYEFNNIQPVKTKLKNLFTEFKLDISYKKNINALIQYTIPEGEMPEVTSFANYNTTDFWWLVLVFNNIKNPLKEWPLSHEQVNILVDTVYNDKGMYTKSVYYDMLFEMNEAKRKILLPTPIALNEIVWSYQKQIQGI